MWSKTKSGLIRFLTDSFIFILYLMTFRVSGFNIDTGNAVILEGASGSYFGYSVAIMENKWILVGAPTANDTAMPTVDSPGGVYRCPLPGSTNNTCTMLDIDSKTGSDSKDFDGLTRYFKHGRSGQWLGGTIQVPHDPDSAAAIVTCAHRWYNTYFADWYMLGLCYLIPQDFTMKNTEKLPILVLQKRMTDEFENGRTGYDWGMAGYGMSAHYTDLDDHVLFGAPGMKIWSGGLIDMANSKAKVMESDKAKLENETQSNLAGYALTSGHYFLDGEEIYAMGIPRSDLIGKVRLYMGYAHEYNLENYVVEIPGTDMNNQALPMNSYFGSSLCTDDVNADGLDDLLVGAPMYSPRSKVEHGTDIELGAVFLYLGTTNKTQFRKPVEVLLGEEVVYGRFGTSIISLGDISTDGFTDIAVGAPYEDDQRGAVYIYNGYSGGVWPAYSQRILASSLSPNLFGFGVSMSNAAHVNADDIKDIVVGSYLSDKAVVLFGQPVISLLAEFYVRNLTSGLATSYIEGDGSTTGIRVCFLYNYRWCSRITLNLTVTLDEGRTDLERLVFHDGLLPVVTHTARLFPNDRSCYNFDRLLVKSTNDLVTPITVQAKYGIENIICSTSINPAIKKFDGNNPGDPNLLLEQEVEFVKECPDNTCKTDLHVDARAVFQSSDGYFVIGTSNLNMSITVTKNGNPSYNSVFYLVYPNFLGYSKIEQTRGEEVTCTLLVTSSYDNDAEEDNDGKNEVIKEALQVIQTAGILNVTDEMSILMCSFGNPLRNDTGVNVTVIMDVPVLVTQEMMTLALVASTQSQEQDPSDNTATIDVHMRHHVSASLSGISTTNEMFIRESSPSYSFEHIYEIENHGPSTLPGIFVTMHIPEVTSGNNVLLKLNTSEVKCGYPCEVSCNMLEDTGISTRSLAVNGLNTTMGAEVPLKANIKHTDCSGTTPCTQLVCNISTISPGTSAAFYLDFLADHGIDELMKDNKQIVIISRGEGLIQDTSVLTDMTHFSKQLSTKFTPYTPTKTELPWWVILLSILGGLLIIAVCVLILYKIGFFKRKTHDELMQMRKSEAYKERPPVDNQSYTDSNDGIIEHEQISDKQDGT